MIRFRAVEEPEEFDDLCRKRGERWLQEHPAVRRPRDFWTRFKPGLAEGFHHLCGYSAMFEPVGTVDHFVSWAEDPSLAYEWSNYRFAAGWINASKQNLAAADLLDPFDVEDCWFELLLPSLQLVVSADIPVEVREQAQFMLRRLHLRDDERVLRQRREWYRMYQEGELSLAGLEKKAPLIARAVTRAENS